MLRHRLLRRAAELRLELLGDLPRDRRLRAGEVAERRLVLLAPEVPVRAAVDQLRADAHRVARLRHAHGQQRLHAEVVGDRLRRRVLSFVAEHRRPRDDGEVGDARKVVDERLGDAVAEVIGSAIGAARYRKHGERADGRAPALAAVAHPPANDDGDDDDGRDDHRDRACRSRRRHFLRDALADRRGDERPQRERQVARRLEPPLGVLLDAAPHDALVLRRHVPWQLRDVVAHHAADRVDRAAGDERIPSRDRLVEDAAEGEDVGGRERGLAAELLRRHVAERADDRRLVGQLVAVEALGLDGVAVRRRRPRPRLGQAEVEQLHHAVARDEDVLRLEVAMDDAARVRRREAVGDGRADLDGPPPRQRAALEEAAQRVALEQLRDDVGEVALLLELIERQDVRMRDGRDRLRLALETDARLLVRGETVGEDFERDVAADALVVGAVDLAHAACPDRLDDVVRANARSDAQSQVGKGYRVRACA